MSRIFGDVRQIAYVTDDMERALTFLHETAGIGPWFVARDVPVAQCRYRGEPIEIRIDAALANSGDMQVEVIQQHSPGASIYTEFAGRHGFGLTPHHYSSWSERYDAVMQAALAKGFAIVQEGRSRYGPFVYYQHPAEPDFTFEVTELTAERRSIFDQIRAAAVGWDGTDPIREGWPEPIL
ncbi:VOC family protein [Sinisalibacter aestuarii]|uniref:Glyoxalase n=1 Tax=Sinisalibacter aestuarii TaxID=2949426 RepID=A0ABQ5LZB1_9RHOB|nr:VOC family protein [Sinisalibacter aestuarii]GKY89606.1 glyoxalase [Sinisalibacter aestuarii]